MQKDLKVSSLTKEDISLLRDVSIHNILNLANQGRDIKMCCPFHGERTPSFVLHPDNSYHCFGQCNVHGFGAIDFCSHLGLSFRQSLEELIKYV